MHQAFSAFDARIEHIRQSPRDTGRLELVARRPAIGVREVLTDGMLDPIHGLMGDNWWMRGGSSAATTSSDPRKQITVMNARAIDLLAGGRDRWALAGDQLFVDFDLSASNVPPGTRIQIGSAVIEVTAPPHRGCDKFTACYGADATELVNSAAGIELNLRGINAKVIQGGPIRVGDPVRIIVLSR